jgi:hypothetical protein
MLSIFIYYFILDTIVDLSHNLTINCIFKHPTILFILILHHFFSCFLLGGWLFDFKPLLIIHIITVITTFIYWRKNENLCDLTILVNEKCGWKRDKPFRDLLDVIGLKNMRNWNEYGHYIVIILGGLFSLYKIAIQ